MQDIQRSTVVSTILGIAGAGMILAAAIILMDWPATAILIGLLGAFTLPAICLTMAERIPGRFGYVFVALGWMALASLAYQSASETVLSGATPGMSADEQKAAEEKEAARLAFIAEFKATKDQELTTLQAWMEEGSYQQVIDRAIELRAADDTDIQALRKEAEDRLLAENNKQRTAEIVQQLRSIPASKIYENKNLYRELVTINPDNEKFASKLAHYSDLVEVQENKRKKQLAIIGKMPIQSRWDGSYMEVDQYLEAVANDPDSIDIQGCTKPYFTTQGWMVGCDYRGRNGFGGMIRQSSWFTIVRNRVVSMGNADSFRP